MGRTSERLEPGDTPCRRGVAAGGRAGRGRPGGLWQEQALCCGRQRQRGLQLLVGRQELWAGGSWAPE